MTKQFLIWTVALGLTALTCCNSATDNIDIKNLSGSWTTTDTLMTPIKLIFLKDKIQILHDNTAGLVLEPTTKHLLDSASQADPLTFYSYKIQNDTIRCRYLSTVADSLANHQAMFKIYKKTSDTLSMLARGNDYQINFVKDKK